VPGIPQNFDAVSDGNQAILSWTAPIDDGGASITFEVSINNGSWIPADSMTGHTFTSLANGTHNFRVRAVNSAGAGAHASASATISVTTVSRPSLTVSKNDITSTSVTLTGFISDTGSASITARGFWIRRFDETNATEVLIDTTSDMFTYKIAGLTPNTTYHARAIARNDGTSGTGQSDEIIFTTPPSDTTTPSVPGIPQNFNAVPSGNQVALTWAAANNGGAAIIRYEVSRNNGVTWVELGSTAMSHTFTGLPMERIHFGSGL